MEKIIVIGGATGVGKTSFSIELAKKFNGEILNADASQFHKLLNIGTSKIKEDEMQGIKHHFIDFLDINEDYSIYDFQVNGRKTIKSILDDNKLPIIVGGSGLYIDALINDYDLSINKSAHNDDKYNDLTNDELYALLDSINHDLASKTHPNNRQRVLRYIERANDILNGKDSVSKDPKAMYDYLFLYLYRDRDVLYNRINERTLQMMNDGWIEECSQLLSKNVNLSNVKEIGYKEINDYLNNQINYDELVELIQKDTRHYAKRQITWFKNKANAVSVDMDNLDISEVYKLINDFLYNK